MSNGSNIAAAINAAHASVEQAKREGVRHAIECGRLLHEAKATVTHGQWDAWVRSSVRFRCELRSFICGLPRMLVTIQQKRNALRI